MYKKNPKIRKVLLIALTSTLILIFLLIFIIKPYFFYKQPFKLFGYVAYNSASYQGYAYTTSNKGFYVSKILDDGEITDDYLFEINSVCYGIAIAEGSLLVGCENGSLIHYNIDDPNNISEISRILLNETVLGISYKDSIIYASTAKGSIHSLSWDDLEILDTYSIGSEYISDIELYNDLLLYASIDSGVGVLDITDPSNMTSIKRIYNTDSSFNINIYEDKLFVSRHMHGLSIFEISDNDDFNLIETINTTGEIYSSDFDGRYLIIGDLQKGIEKWEYNESSESFILQNTYPKFVPHYLYIYDNHIVIADQDRGLYVLQLTD